MAKTIETPLEEKLSHFGPLELNMLLTGIKIELKPSRLYNYPGI
jgi:hypothetical protein